MAPSTHSRTPSFNPSDHGSNAEHKPALFQTITDAPTSPPRSEAGASSSGTLRGTLTNIRHSSMAWICLIAAMLCFVLTVLYATNPSVLSGIHSINSSIPRSIRVLRILSGVTDALLAACCYTAFEKVQWLLSGRDHGLAASIYLSLDSSTALAGTFALATTRTTTATPARLFATLRLVVIIMIPAIGILLMSDVDTTSVSYVVKRYMANYGAGVGPFDPSLAPKLSMEIDRFFSQTAVSALGNAQQSIELTNPGSRSMSCADGPQPGQVLTCERTVFMPGPAPDELQFLDELPEADLLVAFNMNGYMLRFGGSTKYTTPNFTAAHCHPYGLDRTAASVCLQNIAPNHLLAGMVKCPLDLARSGSCLSDRSWIANNTAAVTTSLITTFRRGEVAYHRRNQTIATVRFTDDQEVQAPINATDLLRTYDSFAKGSNSLVGDIVQFYQTHSTGSAGSGGDLLSGLASPTDADSTSSADTAAASTLASLIDGLLSSGTNDEPLVVTKRQLPDISGLLTSLGGGQSLPGSNPVFPILPYMYMEVCDLVASRNSAIGTACVNFLQNLLSIPLFLCNNRIYITGTLQGSGGIDVTEPFVNATGSGIPADIVPIMEQYLAIDAANLARVRSEAIPSALALSRLGYTIKVGPASLWTYVVLVATLLALSLGVMIADAIWGDANLKTVSFPLVNTALYRALLDDDRNPPTNPAMAALRQDCSTQQLLKALQPYRIRPSENVGR